MTTFYKPTALSDQMWSWLFVVTGAIMVIVFRHYGIDVGIAAAVIGGGLQSFTSAVKSQQTNVNSVVDSSVK